MDDGYWLPTPLGVEERLRQTADGWDELHLYQLYLPEVPAEVRGFRHLRTAYLYNCDLPALPAWLAELPELSLLDVSRNRLTEVPFALLARTGLELRISGNPLDLGRAFRTLVENYNEARFEQVAAACSAEVTMHLPGVRPAHGTGPDGVARMLGDAYPRFGRLEVVEAGAERAVVKPARAAPIPLRLTWRYGRLRTVIGGLS
ncbi:hypothetical protein BJ973_001580 [Actinoplanes tereljensis]|uniref:Leucine-rich repeat domain-containing protein n=1 Tax=Paractinoplanes tereljensis TaxID=571912 RepID=A0A919NKP0_9ACTN|nr:leucine-rich repeat domain-containing protein [Actinoplanes tereljensis]GIF20515.1 hypothetical protein Ate02nite_32450 [Actinoplanes tereljensis]